MGRCKGEAHERFVAALGCSSQTEMERKERARRDFRQEHEGGERSTTGSLWVFGSE